MWTSQRTSSIHALTGGVGTPVVLVPGWPQTADAYEDVFSALAERHRVLSIDPPGLGNSGPSETGYDTEAISTLLNEALQPHMEEAFHLVGHDVGAWIAYAWAAQFPGRIKSLTLLDSALPGLTAPRSFPLPSEVNVKLWQFSFNTLPELPETLTAGREGELFDWLIDHKAVHPERISAAHRQRYAECYALPGAMSRGFAYYRAAALSGVQNAEFGKHKLPMPVLALGGSAAIGDTLRQSLEALAVHVEGGVIDDCGHYMMEEQPEEVSRRLLEFFARVESAAL
ncbi:hypothetical protein MMC19_007775 [Ptychographa xylographoides]|nr:hypothetical protein [Ptychographa xylographoides]